MSTPYKADLPSALGSRIASLLRFRPKGVLAVLSTGILEVDAVAGGLPRGAITEICGPASSGRTSLLDAILAEATGRREVCALVDTTDTFDPASAAAAGVDLEQLLWVRCAAHTRHLLQVTDLLAQAGGFGLVALDLGDIPPKDARRIPLNAWFRFRRAIENTPTILVVLTQEPCAGSSSSLVLRMNREREAWSGLPGCSHLLRGAVLQVERKKPTHALECGRRSAECGVEHKPPSRVYSAVPNGTATTATFKVRAAG